MSRRRRPIFSKKTSEFLKMTTTALDRDDASNENS